jgi:hypothetical protein
MTAAVRKTAVSPFAVVMDAVDVGAGSTGMAQPASGNFADHDYRWNWDNAFWAGTFGVSGDSKNRAIGQVAATVLEKVGTYDVTCVLTDANGSATTYEETVTATDAGAAYAGQTQYYSESSGNDSNSGTITSPKRTWANAMAYLFASNGPRRVLFKRGDTFPVTAGTSASGKTGPFHIGEYGTGANRSGR